MLNLREIERNVILSRLVSFKGNKVHTARSLGIGLRTLQRKLKNYGVTSGGSQKQEIQADTEMVAAHLLQENLNAKGGN